MERLGAECGPFCCCLILPPSLPVCRESAISSRWGRWGGVSEEEGEREVHAGEGEYFNRRRSDNNQEST